jgi:hypothetical protein
MRFRQRPLKIGLTRVNECCVFTWTQEQLDTDKVIEIQPWHCDDCVEAALQLGFSVPDKIYVKETT